ncbi:MAG: hypothetical protein GY835_03630 [bacterium]|nr:hypothetical protein [bacterium]
MMQPSKLVFVEDDEGRIEHMLLAVAKKPDLLPDFRNAACGILKQCRGHYEPVSPQATLIDYYDEEFMAGYCESDDFEIKYYNKAPKSSSRSIILICPDSRDQNFERVEDLLNPCAHLPTICFLDLQLKRQVLDDLAALKSNMPLDRRLRDIEAGKYIGELFGKKFGRLLVQASSRGQHYGYEIGGDNFINVSAVAETDIGAEELIRRAFQAYGDRYALHPVQEIAEFLWLFYRGFSEDWDYRPFSHSSLRGDSRCLKEIRRFLANDGGCLDLTKWGQSPKGLFWVDGEAKSTDECRCISQDALKTTLDRLGVQTTLNADPSLQWRFPFTPALALLMSLRQFLWRHTQKGGGNGELPEVTFGAKIDCGNFIGSIVVRYPYGCGALLERFYKRSNYNTTRPTQHRSLSQGLFDFLRSQVEVETCDRDELKAFSEPWDRSDAKPLGRSLDFEISDQEIVVTWRRKKCKN